MERVKTEKKQRPSVIMWRKWKLSCRRHTRHFVSQCLYIAISCSPVNGRSVPASCVTWNCRGVKRSFKFFFKSSDDIVLLSSFAVAVETWQCFFGFNIKYKIYWSPAQSWWTNQNDFKLSRDAMMHLNAHLWKLTSVCDWFHFHIFTIQNRRCMTTWNLWVRRVLAIYRHKHSRTLRCYDFLLYDISQ